MSRQGAIITGILVILLLLMCNVAVAMFAIPRVLAVVREGNPPVAAQPTAQRPASQAQSPAAAATPTPNARPQGQPTRSPSQGGQPQLPMPQVTLVSPGSSGLQGLPSATPGATPTLGPSPTPFPTVAPLAMTAQEQALAALYNRTRPGVVNIDVTMDAGGAQLPIQPTGSGSGFVLDKQGHIVTNSHVVADGKTIKVTLWDDTVVSATIVGADPDADLAVLKIDVPADKLVPLELGDSDQVRVGQLAIAMGNPFAVGTSMSLGIVSAIGRSIPGLTLFQIPDAIQTDAPINPGNSGGPLMDAAGRVIGVNAQIRSDTRANSGVGFAIPVNIVKLIVPDLIAKGRHAWPWLGVSGVTITQPIADANKIKQVAGAYIDSIVSGGPADKAGIHGSTSQNRTPDGTVPVGGDVIIAVDGVPVKHFDDVLRYVTTKARAGQTVELTILRDGQTQKVKLTLEERPRTQQSPSLPIRP